MVVFTIVLFIITVYLLYERFTPNKSYLWCKSHPNSPGLYWAAKKLGTTELIYVYISKYDSKLYFWQFDITGAVVVNYDFSKFDMFLKIKAP